MRKDDSCSSSCVIAEADAVWWCSLSIRRARNREYPASKATKMGFKLMVSTEKQNLKASIIKNEEIFFSLMSSNYGL